MRIKTPKLNWRAGKHGTISLCMIMRDSSKTLSRCLNSCLGLVDEIVIVDTGSVDNSVEIAKSYGASVYFDAWQDDFARPRNIGLSKATCQWLLIMDPDEVLERSHHEKIRSLTNATQYDAFWITTRNYSPPTGEVGYRKAVGIPDPTGKFIGYTPSTKTRLFKNFKGIVFEGCWHELVDWYLLRNKMRVCQTDVIVHHWNHEITQKNIQEKSDFYLRMGEKKIREMPTHGQAWWELAVAEMIHGLRARAAHSIAQAFRYGFGTQHQFFSLARCLHLLGNAQDSRLAFEKGICNLFPTLTHIDPAKKPMGAILDKL